MRVETMIKVIEERSTDVVSRCWAGRRGDRRSGERTRATDACVPSDSAPVDLEALDDAVALERRDDNVE